MLVDILHTCSRDTFADAHCVCSRRGQGSCLLNIDLTGSLCEDISLDLAFSILQQIALLRLSQRNDDIIVMLFLFQDRLTNCVVYEARTTQGGVCGDLHRLSNLVIVTYCRLWTLPLTIYT